MRKILILLLFPVFVFAQTPDATIKTNTNSFIRNTSNVTRANHALINDQITDSKESRIRPFIASGTNTYTVTIPYVTSYLFGLTVYVQFTNANSGTSTINITGASGSPLGAKTLKKSVLTDLVTGDILAGEFKELWYDGTNFQVRGAGGGGGGGIALTDLSASSPLSYNSGTGAFTFPSWPSNASGVLTNNGSGTLSWASAFALSNGNGTTASGTSVNLGGTVNNNIIIANDDDVNVREIIIRNGSTIDNGSTELTLYSDPTASTYFTSIGSQKSSQNVTLSVSADTGGSFFQDLRSGTNQTGLQYSVAGTVVKSIFHSGAWANYADAGGFTIASLAEAQAGNDNTKGMTPLRISQISKDKSIGKIYANDNFPNLNDFDITGTSPTIVSNEIQFSNSFTFDHYARLKTSVANATSRQNWYFSTMIKVGSGGLGGWFGLKSLAITERSLVTTWSSNTLALQGNSGGAFSALSTATLSASTNDFLFIDMRRIGNRIIITGRNITTNSAQVVISYIFPSGNVTPITTPNTARWVIGSFGNVTFKNISISSPDQQGADLAVIGDSITDLYSVSDFSKTFTNILRRTYDVITFAGPSDTSTDALARVQEVIDANPKNVILYCWINDTASGLSTATSTANVDALYTALNAAGINVLFMNYYNTVASLTYMETHLSTNYPSRLIDPRPLMNTNALNADGVHMNDLGNEIYAAAIKASDKIVVGKNYGGLKSQLDRTSIEIGTPVLNGTIGSVPFFDVNGIQQDNSNLFWDNSNNRLGIGTNAPTFTQDIRSADYYQQFIKNTNSSTIAGTVYENDRSATNNAVVSIRGSSVGGTVFGAALADWFTIAGYGANSEGIALGMLTAKPVNFYTNNTERLSIASTGAFGLGGANYGTSGQVLTSQGSGSAPIWTTASGGTYYAPNTIVSNATDANFTATVNGVHNILDGVASTNRVITIPTGANGDVMKFYNTEDTRVWSFTGATVYLADRVTVVTELLYNVPCHMEKIDGIWVITN
jgi:hypothetical protein